MRTSFIPRLLTYYNATSRANHRFHLTGHHILNPTVNRNIVTMAKTLPFADITVPSPGFGAMGLSYGLGSNLSLEEAEPVLLRALELGCTFWDTAVRHALTPSSASSGC